MELFIVIEDVEEEYLREKINTNFLTCSYWDYNWLYVCVSPKFTCWNPNPYVMLWGSGAFGRQLDHKGRAILNEISALQKGIPESSQRFCHVRTWEEGGVQHRKGPSLEPDYSALWFPNFRSMKNKFLLFISMQSVVVCHSSPKWLRNDCGTID